jgi:HrpA-like RNA helicase
MEKTVLDHKESEHLYVFLNNCFQNNLHPSVKLKVAAVTNHKILKNSIISRPYIQSRNSWLQRLGSLKVQEIRKQTELLPAFRYFDTIVSTIMINPITIICGMTGSGKVNIKV